MTIRKLIAALALTALIAVPASAQAQQISAIVIRAESSWSWSWFFGGSTDLMAAALEAATKAARARGLRVLAAPPPQTPAPVLTIAVSAGQPRPTTIGGITAQIASVTVRATLEQTDGDIWRGSQTRVAAWLVQPVQLGDADSALLRATYSAATAVTEAALSTLLPAGAPITPAPQPAESPDKP